INTAIFTRSGGSIGIGFAIPSNMARVIFESSLSGDRVQRPWFGASLQAMSAEIALSLGLERPLGVLITDVYDPGPATRGGLKTGDVILSVDGEEIDDPQELNYRLATRGVGGTASLIVLRQGRQFPVSLALETPPEIPPRDETLLRGNSPFEGATVGNLSPALASELRRNISERGVIVLSIEPGSWAHQVRFKPGDIIRIVNNVDINSVDDLESVTEGSSREWALAVERDGRLIKVLLRG
ncbi:MAG: PDZ domain-containing protein, partial [Fimbriimonadaceae bacterium]|nr:PDZ domain-containing protein [Alphaproteobacteria bacterium]